MGDGTSRGLTWEGDDLDLAEAALFYMIGKNIEVTPANMTDAANAILKRHGIDPVVIETTRLDLDAGIVVWTIQPPHEVRMIRFGRGGGDGPAGD